MITKSAFINRFTTIPFVIDLLTRKQLTLLNPYSWEDYNDRVTMELYQKRMKAKSIYALCLTDQRETIHHWNAFANGASGCCIEFDMNTLLDCLKSHEEVKHDKVSYIKIPDLKNLKEDNHRLPFLKREPFLLESEYRIVALSDQPQKATLDIPLKIDSINRITISCKLPDTAFTSVEKLLANISPDFKGKISHSTLFNNANWTNHFTQDS
jgi:hypothetical protein